MRQRIALAIAAFVGFGVGFSGFWLFMFFITWEHEQKTTGDPWLALILAALCFLFGTGFALQVLLGNRGNLRMDDRGLEWKPKRGKHRTIAWSEVEKISFPWASWQRSGVINLGIFGQASARPIWLTFLHKDQIPVILAKLERHLGDRFDFHAPALWPRAPSHPVRMTLYLVFIALWYWLVVPKAEDSFELLTVWSFPIILFGPVFPLIPYFAAGLREVLKLEEYHRFISRKPQ